MLTQDYYRKVLLRAAEEGCDTLRIVSGYASAAMAFRHMGDLLKVSSDLRVDLLVGMCPADGISSADHRGFQEMCSTYYPGAFSCRYVVRNAPVHSKVYAWIRGGRSQVAFTGSANYTQMAFLGPQREVMTSCDSDSASDYYASLLEDAVSCLDPNAPTMLQVYERRIRTNVHQSQVAVSHEVPSGTFEVNGLPRVELSLLDYRGNMHASSGLNWGQRPKYGREPNQAYIPVPSDVGRTDFFPPRKTRFTVLTDDGKVFVCVRAQDNGKAIHTPEDNSLFGRYFRHRTGMGDGARMTKEALVNYGRTSVVFYKVSDETFYMDFSRP